MHELICTCYIHLDSFVFTCILFFPLYVVFYYVTLLYLKCSIVLRVRIKDDDDDLVSMPGEVKDPTQGVNV